MLVGIEKVLLEREVNGVLVEGDTNTVLAGALAASKLGVRVGHVEAGLRSWDRRMPEELNRIVADHLSDWLFAPTSTSKENLLREGIPESKVAVTGNTIVDAVKQNVKLASKASVEGYVREGERYILATVHRQENVDVPSRLRKIMRGLELAGKGLGFPVVYPAHPRSRKAIRRFGLKADRRWLRISPPASYLQFLALERGAKLVCTDSGGVQEEACILGVPCVTLRDSTERPETLEVGANVLAGADPRNISRKAEEMIQKKGRWRNPFGDGRAAERIVKAWTEV
jgi:UDP-N-acetylglucosamine 2-epimerase (non-hydrolysing)